MRGELQRCSDEPSKKGNRVLPVEGVSSCNRKSLGLLTGDKIKGVRRFRKVEKVPAEKKESNSCTVHYSRTACWTRRWHCC